MIISFHSLPDDFPLDGTFTIRDWNGRSAVLLHVDSGLVPELAKTARKTAGLSQDAVAKMVGIRRGSYSNIERGKCKPSVPVAKRIAEVLGLNWTMFFTEE